MSILKLSYSVRTGYVFGVSVTTAWHVLGLRMVWRAAMNIVNKQSRTAYKGWSSSLGVGRVADYFR